MLKERVKPLGIKKQRSDIKARGLKTKARRLIKQRSDKKSARERTRTFTGLPPPAPQAGVSTNSTTRAVCYEERLY